MPTSNLDREIAVTDAQLETLDERDKVLERLIQGMEELRASIRMEALQLETKKQHLEAQRYPINWLPAEILARIFVMFTLADDIALPGNMILATHHHAPVTLSHVCHKWRDLSLSMSCLWTCIIYRAFLWHPLPVATFLERSRHSSLHIFFSSPALQMSLTECRIMRKFLSLTSVHGERWRSAIFQCWFPITFTVVAGLLQALDDTLPQLRYLDLSIAAPSYPQAVLRSPLDDDDTSSSMSRSSRPSHWLRLHQVTFFELPGHFLSELRSLELLFPPRKMREDIPPNRGPRILSMSDLCHLLSTLPRLETLILRDFAPIYDVKVPSDTTSKTRYIVQPVELTKLTRIEWAYPVYADVHRFLSMLVTPALQTLDVCLYDRRAVHEWLESEMDWRPASHDGALHFPSVTELSVQCSSVDTIGPALRKLSLPMLIKLELAAENVAPECICVPWLPRLESALRDPRLPHLTHLSLSCFSVGLEHREGLLGYIPALTSLSLDSCIGAQIILEALGENRIVGRRGVKFCPRLEALSFRTCDDVKFSTLQNVVRSRNLFSDGEDGREGAGRAAESGDGAEAAGRKIKPLRRPRQQAHMGASTKVDVTPSSIMLSVDETSKPSPVTYVQIVDCAEITEEQASSLAGLGVQQVAWRGVDPPTERIHLVPTD
jgi:hypothetical protein